MFQSELSTYSLILFSKIKKLYRIKELFQSDQTGYGVSYVYLNSKTKRIFAKACLGKNLVLHTEICGHFKQICYYNFKIMSISRGQGVIQI